MTARVLAAVALMPAIAVFALTALSVMVLVVPGPDSDVYLEGHEVWTFGALALAELAIVGYAAWNLVAFLRGRAISFSWTAFAYVIGGLAAPSLYLLAVRWFSGG